MNNRYERPQELNPNRFSIKQHFIPVESIKRFCNEKNEVILTNLISKNKKTVNAKPTDEIFIVKRLWNQEAEERLMKSIEDKFQSLIDKIIDHKIHILTQDDNRTISMMYGLWEARVESISCFKDELKEHLFIPLSVKGNKITKSEQEILEKKYCSYVNNEGALPTRDYFNLRIRLFLHRRIKEYENIAWGVLYSNYSNFIMPSNPIYKTSEIIFPVAPKIALVPNSVYDVITKEDVKYFNRLMIENSKWFYFTKL